MNLISSKVFSKSVADALIFMNDDTVETEKFVRIMDQFFDCLNVRSISEGVRQLKPNLRPYRNSDDERLMVRKYAN